MIEHLLFLSLRTARQRSWNELLRSTGDMQSACLMDMLPRNRDTAFGKEHSSEDIRTVKQFREPVPVRSYEEFEPYIAPIRHGEKNVLTRRLYAAPCDVMCLKDFDAKYYLILRFALERNVTTIAALNPSTILLLMKKLNRHAAEFARDIADGTLCRDLNISSRLRRDIEEGLRSNRKRGRELVALAARGGVIRGTDVWKNLTVTSRTTRCSCTR